MKCKPGDLAYIVHSPYAPENVGRVVKVLQLDYFFGEPVWWVSSQSPIIATSNGGRNPEMVFERPYKDRCLRPISGLPLQDEEHNEVTA